MGIINTVSIVRHDETYPNCKVFATFILLSLPGNLALSRALGDFIFKKNPSKSVEEQIVTG